MLTVVAGVAERGGRLMICRRRPDARNALKWEFPGGKIEAGESPAGVAKAKETYEFITGEEYAGRAAAEKWIAEEYQPPEEPAPEDKEKEDGIRTYQLVSRPYEKDQGTDKRQFKTC